MNTKILDLAKKLIKEVKESNGDEIKVVSGAFLTTRDNIIADQEMWGDGDESKNSDFTTCPYWITTDNGIDPIGVTDAEDLATILEDQLSSLIED